MTILTKRFEKCDNALRYLESLVDQNDLIVFRGQQDTSWRLQTTLARYRQIPYEVWSSDIDQILDLFKANLARLGNLPPFEDEDRASWLEFAQHNGVPTPYLDFTYSPYVALFFAFNGLRNISLGNRKKGYVVVYALNITQLAHIHSWNSNPLTGDGCFSHESYWQFQYPERKIFSNGFPANTLQFIPYASKHNARMLRQHGAFLYDTFNYQYSKYQDLEDYLEQSQEPYVTGDGNVRKRGNPVLTKILINKQCVRQVFQRLELMGVTGTMLFLDSTGVAMDTRNTYFYNPKTMYLRDGRIPSPSIE